MTSRQTGFTRARSPAQKAQRRDDILAAARRLAAEHGVPAITLGDLADEVGLAKSNVVRYFGTREEIFVELCIDESLVLRDLVVERLAAAAAPGHVAGVVADAVAGAPVFCEVVGLLPTHLEHNVSFDAALRLKVTTAGVLDDLRVALVAAVPGLDPADAARALGAVVLLASGLWAMARPSSVVREVYAARPDLGSALAADAAEGSVREQLEPVVAAMLRGFVPPSSRLAR